jgi:hypothetical protein
VGVRQVVGTATDQPNLAIRSATLGVLPLEGSSHRDSVEGTRVRSPVSESRSGTLNRGQEDNGDHGVSLVGVALLGLNAIDGMFSLPAYPLW